MHIDFIFSDIVRILYLSCNVKTPKAIAKLSKKSRNKCRSSRFVFMVASALILLPYESEFLQKLVKDKKIHEARAFNFTYRYIDDVLSINNSRFAEFLPLIYPPELEVKETTDTASSASFLDLYLEFDDSGQLSTKIYDKRDDFTF